MLVGSPGIINEVGGNKIRRVMIVLRERDGGSGRIMLDGRMTDKSPKQRDPWSSLEAVRVAMLR